jgi:Transposase DDE domain
MKRMQPRKYALARGLAVQGKAHKKYEFGSKVSVASLSGSNVVVGITSFAGNPHNSKTLAPTLDQVAQWTDRRYKRVLVDKGYRGHGQVGDLAVIIPGKKAHASALHCVDTRAAVSTAQR